MIIVVATGSASAQSPDPTDGRDTPEAGAEQRPAAEAAPVPAPAIDRLTLDDDLIAAVGLRTLGEHRLEALVSTGNDATSRAALRATDTFRGVGVEVTGDVQRSDVAVDRTAAAARVERTSERNAERAYASYGGAHVGRLTQTFTTDLRAATYGAAWTGWRASGTYTVEAYGEQQTLHDDRTSAELELDGALLGAHAGYASRRVQAFGLDHQFAGDIDVAQAAGEADESEHDAGGAEHMNILPRTKHGETRLLRAYIHDTVRVIESLDVHGGFVFEHWRWISNLTSIYEPDHGENMNLDEVEQISSLVIGPKVGAVWHATPALTLEAGAYRQLRTPTWQQLMRPVQNGSVLTTADTDLRAATVTGASAGPTLTKGVFEARAVAYWNEVASPIAEVTIDESRRELENLGHARETGVDAAATWRIAAPLLAGVGYTFTHAVVTDADDHPELVGKRLAHTPHHRASAMLAYDNPKIVTLTGAVRVEGERFDDDRNTIALAPYIVVDALAARKLTHGLAGFVSVENMFDRRYVTNRAGVDTIGTPRLVQVGVRLDSARW
jgi:outer membrane receptor protein involved in Fe transport